MEIRKVIFDPETFGTTSRSLKMLRNELARRIDHKIAVCCIPTNELLATFVIFDKDTAEAVITGDGFRTDAAGEGGAGYRLAEQFLRQVFSVEPIWFDSDQILPLHELSLQFTREDFKLDEAALEVALRERLTPYLNHLSEKDFVVPAERRPRY